MSDGTDKGKQPFYYGGQAVLEGVMMRGQKAWSLAVRRPAGDIYLERHALRPLASRVKLFKLPFFRGIGVRAAGLFLCAAIGISFPPTALLLWSFVRKNLIVLYQAKEG